MDLPTIDHLLTTTRSVRKRLDLTRPVEHEIIERALEIAIQAPSGGNRQSWHFMVITNSALRRQIGEYYRQSFEIYRGPKRKPVSERIRSPQLRQLQRITDSSQHLADHMHEVPVMIIPCITGRVESMSSLELASLYGSILPATWSLMLALRARGIGSAWTTLHLRYEQEIAALLDVPDTVTQVALLPVAYFTGDDFKPAKRKPPTQITYWNQWSQPREDQAPSHPQPDVQ